MKRLIKCRLRDQLWDQLGVQVNNQLGDRTINPLWFGFKRHLWDHLWDQIVDQVGGQFRDQVRGGLWGQIKKQAFKGVSK